jgi:molybdopterin-containing oxidoreductase family membrane subunit
MAIAIHTVTAFLFVSLVSRPFWNVAILAPRFITSAFCSGPALMVLIFMLLRKVGRFNISTAALTKVGELMAYMMAFNLFLLGAEVFKEFYYVTQHSVHATFQWFGIHGHGVAEHGGRDTPGIAAFAWTALAANLVAFAIFVVPVLRHRTRLLALGCVLAICGVYIEKGLGLLLPGMTPDALGEVYNYGPSLQEVLVGGGVWAVGALIFTLMVRVTMAINDGELRAPVPR